MRPILLVAVPVLLAACAGSPPAVDEEAKHQAISDILSQPLAVEDYSDSERCLSTRVYRSVEVLDDRHVIFKGTGDRVWLNTLRNRCLGLRPRETLRFRMRDNRLCDMDNFDSVDTFFMFFDRSSATCSLGTFTPVTPEQVTAIKGAIADAKQSKKSAP